MSQRRKDRAARLLNEAIAAHELAVEQHRLAAAKCDAAQQSEQDAIAEMRAAPGEEQRRIWLAHRAAMREQAQAQRDYAEIDVQEALDDLAQARRKFLRCSVKHDRIGDMIRKARATLLRLRDDRNSEEHAEASYLRRHLVPSVISEGYAR